MPSGVVLTIPSVAADRLRDIRPGDGAPGAEAAAELAGELFGPRPIGVDDREATDVERQQGVRDGGAGAAGAELHHAPARRIHQLAPEALGEARPVGVVPDRAPVLEHHGVDGAERPRIGGQARRAAGSPPACRDG